MLFAIAALALIVGFGQQTIWRPPAEIVESVDTAAQGDAAAPLAVIDGSALAQHDGKATVVVTGSQRVFAAAGPSSDVDAWVENASVNRITSAGRDLGVSTAGSEQTVPDPAGSDLWTTEQSADGQLHLEVDSVQTSSLLIASDGEQPAPTQISISWPNVNPTPWVRPLQIIGYVLLLGGFVLLLIDRIANRRGPRRRTHRGKRLVTEETKSLKGGVVPGDDYETEAGKAPVVPGKPSNDDSSNTKPASSGPTAQQPPTASASSARPTGERPQTPAAEPATGSADDAESEKANPDKTPGTGAKSRAGLAKKPLRGLFVFAIAGMLALTGCSQADPSAPSSAASDAPADSDQSATPVLKAHFQTILDQIATTASQADAALDPNMLTSRFTGEALAARQGYYAIKSKFPDEPAIDSIVSSPMNVFLPQSGKDFPRTVLVGVQDDQAEGQPKRLLLLQQESARDNYKLKTVINNPIPPIPDLPSELVGSQVIPNDSRDLAIAPGVVGEHYADLLANGDSSQFAAQFDIANDQYLQRRREKVSQQRENLGDDGQLNVTYPPGASAPVALTTADGDGLVFVSVNETWEVKPAKENGVIKDLTAADSAVIGSNETSKGLQRVYSTMLVFRVPKDATQKATLVGYTWQQESIKEL
ncbi:hypothetical protein [Pseudoclavibacter sp. 13-3]|uniref:hypothetical protein n=1 Tax=Pseudoclavibacter sp. 13-3 TaxID=2901228 RepID=UPI001E2C8BA7|nr:hypothetical protein [Pseudoclavibacter sp. 13-3]MCD7100872.1 hypothetical protein [Pseudoclavibacter sp. 13-3]